MNHFFAAFLPLLACGTTVCAFPTSSNDGKLEHRTCYEDNPLRALERFASVANGFCPTFLSTNGKGQPPKELSNFQQWEVYSACSCYEKTASGGARATAAGLLGPTASGGSSAPYPSASMTISTGRAPIGTAPLGTTPMGTVPLNTATATAFNSSDPASGIKARGSVLSGSAISSPVITSGTAAVSSIATSGSIDAGSPAGPIKPGSQGKRGIAYNYKSEPGWSAYFKGSPYAVWGSNWDDSRTDALDLSFTYVPTIVVDSSLSNADWLTTIPGLIQSGSTTLFGSNEPDNAGQANLNVDDCVKVYQNYMQPFAGQAALGTPAVTNGGGTTGLAYLDSFATSCTNCSFDFINVHFYLQRSDVNTVQFSEALKNHIDVNVPAVQAKHDNLKGLPIMIGEFWLTGASDQEGENLMLDLLPYLDGNDKVMGYQAFGGLWEGNWITSDGTGLTPAAQKYNTYSAPPSMTSSL